VITSKASCPETKAKVKKEPTILSIFISISMEGSQAGRQQDGSSQETQTLGLGYVLLAFSLERWRERAVNEANTSKRGDSIIHDVNREDLLRN
jgi:hypothetical protein